jgi:hypothetical protein
MPRTAAQQSQLEAWIWAAEIIAFTDPKAHEVASEMVEQTDAHESPPVSQPQSTGLFGSSICSHSVHLQRRRRTIDSLRVLSEVIVVVPESFPCVFDQEEFLVRASQQVEPSDDFDMGVTVARGRGPRSRWPFRQPAAAATLRDGCYLQKYALATLCTCIFQYSSRLSLRSVSMFLGKSLAMT